MKKYILLCFLCFCLFGSSHAQIYLKGYTGYAMSTGNEKLNSSEIIIDDVRYREYKSSYQLKLGQGVNLGLSIGYALNKNIAFEITGNTQLFSEFYYSMPYKYDFIYDPEIHYHSWSSEGFFGDLEYSNTIFQVSPQVVFKSNPYNQWSFYLKGGPDFVLAKHKETTQTIAFDFPDFNIPNFNSHVPSYSKTTEYFGNINTGIQCSLGAEYKLSKTICVFAELTTVNVSYKFKHSQIQQYEIDGKDSLSTLESTEFNDLDNRAIFNHVGLNVGVKYNFR